MDAKAIRLSSQCELGDKITRAPLALRRGASRHSRSILNISKMELVGGAQFGVRVLGARENPILVVDYVLLHAMHIQPEFAGLNGFGVSQCKPFHRLNAKSSPKECLHFKTIGHRVGSAASAAMNSYLASKSSGSSGKIRSSSSGSFPCLWGSFAARELARLILSGALAAACP
jgi:hypothetical protein